MKPEVLGEFELDARLLLHHDSENGSVQAVLLVTATIAEDHQQGA